ncbi:MAG: ABC-F family ATP-binding cassette domain-containing protein [Eubacteriales bacterium]|nr:ABC-F family ATP-binding cassette domain-containing protein [Eubacteriales bacterium]
MLLELNDCNVFLSGEEILSNVNFRVVDKDKIGIVGKNGSGKTTLLKVLQEEIPIEKSNKQNIIKNKIDRIGFLSQINFSNLEKSVDEELQGAFEDILVYERKIDKLQKELEEKYDEKKANALLDAIEQFNNLGGQTINKEKNSAFLKFGFKKEELNKPLSSFSGGERTKIALIKLLLSRPDIIILDEPTNHLDIEAIDWLSIYLKNYKKALIIVSHDREFLNQICNVIYEIENKQVTRYVGNYDNYIDKKAIDYETKLKTYEKQSEEIKKLNGIYERFRYKPTKAKLALSRLRRKEKLEKEMIQKPLSSSDKSFRTSFIPRKEGSKEVLNVINLKIGYETKTIQTNNINFKLLRKDRLAIIGKNGTGKSTLLKTIVGNLKPLQGEIIFGKDIEYEYFDQDLLKILSNKTIFDDFSDEFPRLTNTEVRNKLGNFLFTSSDVFKQINILSGGEKVRLSLAKIFEHKPNFLILDEPTNHLDILGKEALENILDEYEGTVLFVSHDRYFVKRVSNRILHFNENNEIFLYNDGYEEYVSNSYKENNYESIFEENNKDDNIILSKENNDHLKFKENRKKENYLKKLENDIENFEKEKKELEEKLNDSEIQTNYIILHEIHEKIEILQQKISKAYIEWENNSN